MIRSAFSEVRHSHIRQKFGKGVLLTGAAAACQHAGPLDRSVTQTSDDKVVEIVRCRQCLHHEAWDFS